jgi:hypothetical protein
VSPNRLKVVDWDPLKDNNRKKLDIWKRGGGGVCNVNCRENHAY